MPHQIEAREHDYEMLSAVVYERMEGWYRIEYRTGDRAVPAWVAPEDAGSFHPLRELLMDGLAYLTEEWDRVLFLDPGGYGTRVPATPEGLSDANVIEGREWQGTLWLRIEILGPGRCRDPGEPRVVARGWIEAHAPSGLPNAWFFSRGC